jgi:RNA polymerase sigma factor (sigma-70 family)
LNTHLNTSEERELWKSFQLGDENALAKLYSVYFDQLYNYGAKFSDDSTLVEDCIQELFIKLIRNKQNLAIPDSVKSYLFKALRSYLFDKIKKIKKYPLQDISESMEFHLEPYHEVEIIKQEEYSALQIKMQHAIDQLTPRQREAIFLKYQEGFSYPEIAEMMTLTQKATYKLVGRGIGVLREVLACLFIILINSLMAFLN